ncbi:MAG: hypothetical protein IJ675_03610 [Pseudobutyrivibrio sp.]|nr:hypothetical protein [Pseudobutyrivibrio sp.]
MLIICILMVGAGVVSLYFCFAEYDYFQMFAILIKIVTAVAMVKAFLSYRWDATKGLMGGVLFCLMYQAAHLALDRVWTTDSFDAYLIIGVQGNLFLAGAIMNLLMTVIISLNHFFINYSSKGNPKNVILNRIALVFKVIVCIFLVASNSMLGFASGLRWNRSLQYIMDIAILLLVACMEAQYDSFNVLRQELRKEKRKGI